MKKRWLAVLLAAAMGAALAGCSSGSSDAADTAEEEEEELSEEEQLAGELAENEQVLSKDSSITEVDFESEVPEDDVTIPEGAAVWLRNQDGTVDVAVAEFEEDGEVWLDSGNASDMRDPNTVIHGDTEVLGGIVRLGDSEYFDESPYLYVYTEDAVREYCVFAAYEAETENILVNHNCYNSEKFQTYVEEIFSQSGGLKSVNLNEDLKDELLAIARLVTIQVSVDEESDFIVQAVPTGILVR